MDWRKIEQALVEIAKGNDDIVEHDTKSGDTFVCIERNVGSDHASINATELAKELAERLA